MFLPSPKITAGLGSTEAGVAGVTRLAATVSLSLSLSMHASLPSPSLFVYPFVFSLCIYPTIFDTLYLSISMTLLPYIYSSFVFFCASAHDLNGEIVALGFTLVSLWCPSVSLCVIWSSRGSLVYHSWITWP